MADEYVYDNGFQPKDVTLKDNYKYYNYNIFFRIMQVFCRMITTIFIKTIMIFKGVKVKGKSNFKGVKGAVLVSTHINPLDSFFNVINFPTKNTYITMLQSNMGFGLFSKYIRGCGAVPIPTKMKQFREFENQTLNALNKNKRIIFYPEGGLHPYYKGVREFKKGAFKYSVLSNKPVVPCIFVYRKRKNPNKNPKLTLHYLKPIYPTQDNQRDDIFNLMDKTYNTMLEFFNENSQVK